MDQGLFSKHIRKIKEISDTKINIIRIIKEKTDISLKENEVIISKNSIAINTTSVKKNILVQKNYKQILLDNGYKLD